MTPDRLIADRYRLEGRLGTGGMSTVQHAFDTRLERPVAVKLLAEHLAEDPAFVARFQREAQSAARLIHPNVVQVFDSGLDEPSNRHYIVMELVSGHSCAQLLRDRGYLGVDETVDFVGQACRGLDYAHRNGVVHRDVKPGNLLVSDEGTVKLADFGIAKAAEQSSITQVGSVLGTAAYLAPEQARGEEAGPPADMYSLGVVAYQCLAGRVPYEAQSLTELAYKQQHEAPEPLDSLNGEVKPPLAHAIERALASEPADRYETAVAMGEALRGGMRGIEPLGGAGTEATNVLGAGMATAETRMVQPREASVGPPTPVPAHQPRQPRQPSRRAAPAPVPAATGPARVRRAAAERPPRRRRSFFGRALLTLIVLAVIAGAIVAAVLSQSNSGDRARIRQIVIQNVQQGVDDLKTYVNDNTK